MAFDDLYQEIILDHYRNPCNFDKVEGDATEHENPVCGDKLKLLVQVNDEGIVDNVKFEGVGCAISMASASMMTEAINGKPLAEVEVLMNKVFGSMRGEEDINSLDELGDLVALKGVIKFPVRIKCATLAWHALEESLKEEKE